MISSRFWEISHTMNPTDTTQEKTNFFNALLLGPNRPQRLSKMAIGVKTLAPNI